MKKLIFAMIGVALLLGAMGPAQAASQPFESIIGYETPQAEGPVYVSYWYSGSDKLNPTCTTPGAGQPCETTWTNKPSKQKVGYRGYLEDIYNYDGLDGQLYYAAWDTEFGTGTPEHKGYYVLMARTVNVGDQDDAWAAGCEGTKTTATCLGSAVPDNAAGTDVENTPLGTISPFGGFRPIPVPLPMQPVEGDTIHLSWNEASVLGEPTTITYDLYYVVKNSCDAPTADEFTFLKNVTGTSTDVTAAELGINPDDPNGVFFALKLHYPDRAGIEMTSMYLSANSQCIAFGGIAVEVVDIQAKWLRRNQVQVSWATELEDGVRGFYVLRGYTPNGPFERVSELIPANGEPSKYTYIDTIAPRGRVAASGLFYKIEAIDLDEGQKVFGPAQAELPTPGGQHQIQRRGKHFRF